MKEWKIELLNNRGFVWACFNNVRAKGYVNRESISIKSNELAKEIFVQLQAGKRFGEIISAMNGAFLILVETESTLHLATDIVLGAGTFLYDVHTRFVTDSGESFDRQMHRIDSLGVAENMKSLMYTLDDRTILNGVKHVGAGEIVTIDKSTGQIHREFFYKHNQTGKNKKHNYEDYLGEIQQLSERVFRRLIQSLDGKTAIIPLSGGYDSRYIASMLKALDYTNVVCYTYGYSAATEETGISNRVAERLGFRHFYINQDEAFWKEFMNDSVVNGYFSYCHDLCHTPHIQEIHALQKLQYEKDFPREGVVIPGFCGDLFGGSYTFSTKQKQEHTYDLNELCKFIAANHLSSFYRLSEYKQKILEDISSFFEARNIRPDSLETFNEAFGYWFCCHKVAKYVVPSVKAYEYLGYEWRLPLWDRELVDYWYDIPIEFKQEDSLYDYSLRNLYFKKYDIDYTKQTSMRKQIRGKQTRKLKNVVGYAVLLYFYYRTGKMLLRRDSNNFVTVLKDYYYLTDNKRFVSPFENRWLEPFTMWWMEHQIGSKQTMWLFAGSHTEEERKNEDFHGSWS